jgi:molybdenum cofactor cytidylyltransferase
MRLSVGAIILAAGRSRRMGRPKLLLPWGGTSVLGHLITQWQALGACHIAVVCALDDTAILAEMDRLAFPAEQRIFNPDPERGMFSSIQCAAQWTGWQVALTHWTLVLGDQPHLREETLRKLLEFSTSQPDAICQPAHNGHRRHPVVLPKAAFHQLANSTATDLNQFLKPLPTATCELDDAGLDLDLDQPEDYEEALRLYSGGR